MRQRGRAGQAQPRTRGGVTDLSSRLPLLDGRSFAAVVFGGTRAAAEAAA